MVSAHTGLLTWKGDRKEQRRHLLDVGGVCEEKVVGFRLNVRSDRASSLTLDTAGCTAPTIVYPWRASALKMASKRRMDLASAMLRYGPTQAPASP